jgi:serine/threonine protein kinase
VDDPPGSQPSVNGVQDEKVRAIARVGRVINSKWRLDALLGVGGMASVYAATHRNGSRAALKILHAEFSREPSIRERFLREGYVANRSDHPGRVAILDDDVTEHDEPFLVMELLEGETMQQLWKRRKRKIPPLEALSIMEEVLDTLQSYHVHGVIHRDLKPANIFITKEGAVKLLDFGVARLRDASGLVTHSTHAGTALGTPSFMAPEQAMGLIDEIDGRADVFSVGATLYAVLGGQRLHRARTDNEAFILAATLPAQSLARIAPDLPVEVIALVDKALAWEPRNRFESAAAMRLEMLKLLDTLGREPPPPPSMPALARYRVSHQTLPPPAPDEPSNERPAQLDRTDASDPAVVRLVDLFKRVERLLFTVRQYGWAHPEAGSKLRSAFQSALDALRADAELVYVTLSPYAMEHRGQTIWEPIPPLDSVPYNLFAAGVRRISFLPGITEEQIQSLCEVAMIDPVRDLSPEDDVAAALWERRLEHVRCEVVTLFAEGDADDRESFYAEADDLAEIARKATEERANRAEAAAMSIQTDEASLHAARQAAAVLGLDPAAKRALGAQLQISTGQWAERFTDVLADALQQAGRAGDLELVIRPLAATAKDMLASQRTEALFLMHRALVEAIESCRSNQEPGAARGDDASRLRCELTRGIFTPDLLRALVRQSSGSGARPIGRSEPQMNAPAVARALGPVLDDLGPEHLGAVMDAMQAAPHADLKNALLGYLERVLPSHEAEMIDRVMLLDIAVARPIMKVLSGLKTPGAIEGLRRLSGCATPALRCEAMALLAASSDQLRDELCQLVESPQVELRIATLRTLAHHQLRAAGPLLVRRVQDASFHQLTVDERREILAALHALHPARAESVAIEILQRHGLLTDEATEQTRALSVELLGKEARTIESLQAVLAASRRRLWNSATLRDVASSAAEAIALRLGKRISTSGEIQ